MTNAPITITRLEICSRSLILIFLPYLAAIIWRSARLITSVNARAVERLTSTPLATPYGLWGNQEKHNEAKSSARRRMMARCSSTFAVGVNRVNGER